MHNLDIRQIQYALLTIGIELPIFWVCGYRKLSLLCYFVLANFTSNILLNETLPAYDASLSYWLQLLIGELLVVLLEYTLMRYAINYEKQKLFTVICITNIISLGIGLVMLWFKIFLV
ncbi:MAG: hypothetical protein MJ050_01835 [Phascolarctobacterium sp.]|nr:hypothetical protein [Phascolarctobacterium sp.]